MSLSRLFPALLFALLVASCVDDHDVEPVSDTACRGDCTRVERGRGADASRVAGPPIEPNVVVGPGRCEVPSGLDCGTCTADGESLHFAATIVSVSGTVLVDGGGVPGHRALGWDDWASLRLIDVETGAEYTASLDYTGAYKVALFTGRYRAMLRLGISRRAFPSAPRDVDLGVFDVEEDRVIALNLKSREVSGSLTIDGEALPAGGPVSRGQLLFWDRGTGAVYHVDLPAGGPTTYQARLPAGRPLEVWLATNWSDYGAVTANDQLPRGITRIGVLASDERGTINFNAATRRVSGEITVAGETMPDDTILDGRPRARLRFLAAGPTARPTEITLGEQGPARFDAIVFADATGIELRTDGSGDQSALRPNTIHTLCASGSCRVGDGTQVDVAAGIVDDHGVPFAGSLVVLDGPLRQDRNETVGTLHLNPVGPGRHVSVPVTGCVGFAATVPPGIYDLTFRAPGRTPGADEGPELYGDVRLATGLDLTEGSTDQHFNIETVRLSGEVLVDGATMADASPVGDGPRATLELATHDGSVRLGLGRVGPAAFDVHLVSGLYDVTLATFAESRVRFIYEQDVLPVAARSSLGRVDLASDSGQVEFDVATRVVSGTVDIGGDMSYVERAEPDSIALRFVDVDTHVAGFAAIAPTGGAFETLVFGGSYAVELGHNPSGWGVVDAPFGRSRVSRVCE